MERLVDGIEEVVDVLLEDTRLVVVDLGNVRLDDIGVRTTEKVGAAVAHRARINDIVAIGIVSSGADGVGASDVGGCIGNDR